MCVCACMCVCVCACMRVCTCAYSLALHRIFDGVVENLARNFAEGTEYFKVITLAQMHLL